MNKLIRKAANNQVKYWNFSSQISDESKSNHPLYSNSSEPTTAATRRTANQTESMVVRPPVHIPAKPNDVFITFCEKLVFLAKCTLLCLWLENVSCHAHARLTFSLLLSCYVACKRVAPPWFIDISEDSLLWKSLLLRFSLVLNHLRIKG